MFGRCDPPREKHRVGTRLLLACLEGALGQLIARDACDRNPVSLLTGFQNGRSLLITPNGSDSRREYSSIGMSPVVRLEETILSNRGVYHVTQNCDFVFVGPDGLDVFDTDRCNSDQCRRLQIGKLRL